MQLINNPRFQAEYQEFKNKIQQIQNERVKGELEELLKKLVVEVKMIDQQHSDLMSYSKNPSELNGHRDNLLNLRKKINQRIGDCEKAGLI